MTLESPGKAFSPSRAKSDLFVISALLLFLELACIRWFPAHVIFLTFFTNTVLLACFLGLSLGCLGTHRKTKLILWTPPLLAVTMAAAHGVEFVRRSFSKIVHVQIQTSPQMVFFGTEGGTEDVATFAIPIEVVAAVFFVLIALTFAGLGQEMGRAFAQVQNRLQAYALNISGSILGVLLFYFASLAELSPFVWFLFAAVGTTYFVLRESKIPQLCLPLGSLGLILYLSAWTATSSVDGFAQFWSPYYRIDYHQRSLILVNLIGHQEMVGREKESKPALAYALPYLLRRDSGFPPPENVLIIGAGSGNDVSRAIQWGAKHIDAVEIDPVIYRLGATDHPDLPYRDPRVHIHLGDGRNFLRGCTRKYDLIIYALVDSLVLHSSFSNLRLESFLFTENAFADVRKALKPTGLFVMYNYFRQGWLVTRLKTTIEDVFHAPPLILSMPHRDNIEANAKVEGFTVFLAGQTGPIFEMFARHNTYCLRRFRPPNPSSPNGFLVLPPPQTTNSWERFAPTAVTQDGCRLPPATDDWPYLYLHHPMIPDLSLIGITIIACTSLALLFVFWPRRACNVDNPWRGCVQLSFLGAGFMLVETRAVVNMGLVFGSTWSVNAMVFVAVLLMILASTAIVLTVRPRRNDTMYLLLFSTLALNVLIPLDTFLGMDSWLQTVLCCSLVFSPIFFASVIFATVFAKSAAPECALGCNVVGAVFGGLIENLSMLVGFRYLALVAFGFYLASFIAARCCFSEDRSRAVVISSEHD